MEMKDWLAVGVLPAIGWALAEAWYGYRDRKNKKEGALETAVGEATKAIQFLTITLVELRSDFKAEVRVLTERTDAIPRMKDDLNALGAKVRSLK